MDLHRQDISFFATKCSWSIRPENIVDAHLIDNFSWLYLHVLLKVYFVKLLFMWIAPSLILQCKGHGIM